MDVLRAQRIDGDGCDDGRVDTAREADRGLRIAVLAEEVAQAAAGGLVDEAGAVAARRGHLNRRSLGPGIENAEVLLEVLQHQHRFSLFVERSRRSVVDDFGRSPDLVHDDQVLAFDKGQVAEHLVAVDHRTLAVAAGIDRDDRLDRLVEVVFAAEVVTDDDRALVALDRGVLVALRGDEEAHLAAGRDVFLADVTQHLAVLDEGGGADGSGRGQDRQSDDGGDAVAARGYFDQSVLAEFEEGRLAQQVEGGGSAHGLFGENHQVGMLRFRLVNGVDDLRGIAVHVSDRVIQLSYGYFHANNLSPEITTLQS